ncbi:MAG: hypothetical protein ACLUKH_22110 [Flavonifractor plautii]
MTEDLFLDWAIKLLEQIETSEEKKLWCRRYSVYSRSPGQKTLSRDLHDFVDRTYQAGLVIQNYHEVIQKWGLEERNIAIAPPGWLEMQPYLCVLACIAWHLQRPFLRGPDQSKHRGRGPVTPVSSAQSALSHIGSRRHTTRTLL